MKIISLIYKSMQTPIHLGTIKDGKIHLHNLEKWKAHLARIEGDVEVVVRKQRRIRTTGSINEKGNQNGYLHGVVFPIAAESLGYSVEEMKEIFIQMFSPYTQRKVGNSSITIHMRTHEMNTVQCAEFTNSIIIKMAEMGCVIPDPRLVQND